ncbi:MAG: TolB family protein, partial [Actinomycetota bacterium]
LLSAGKGFDDAPLMMNGDLTAYLPSPDGRRLIAFWADDNDRVEATIVPADGTLPESLGSFPTNEALDEIGPLVPMVWLPDGTWLATPVCQCGGTDVPTHWYSISRTGTLSRANWLGTPADGTPGVSADGRYLSFFDEPFASCGDTCTTGPVSIVIANTMTHTVRTIARFPSTDLEDPFRQSTALSPDGTLVATSLSGSSRVLVMTAKTGKVVQTISVDGHNLRPFAFIDDSTLVLGDDTTIFVARDIGGAVTVTQIAQGNASFDGWTR